MEISENIKIGIAGYGVFGSQFVAWLGQKAPEIQIGYIVEPNRHKRDLLKKMGFICFENIYDAPRDLLKQVGILVDCSPRGQGILNKPHYEDVGLQAIFQNGEEDKSVGSLFYPGLSENIKDGFLRIPLCSGMAAIKVVKVVRKYAECKYVTGLHCKVSNTAIMLTMNYLDSNLQIKELLGTEARMNVIYLRGEPYNNNFAYHGMLDLELDKKISLDQLFLEFADTSNLTAVENQNIDNIAYPKTDLTLVIKESVYMRGNRLSLSTMSFTPDINFPINLEAIKFLHSRS